MSFDVTWHVVRLGVEVKYLPMYFLQYPKRPLGHYIGGMWLYHTKLQEEREEEREKKYS